MQSYKDLIQNLSTRLKHSKAGKNTKKNSNSSHNQPSNQNSSAKVSNKSSGQKTLNGAMSNLTVKKNYTYDDLMNNDASLREISDMGEKNVAFVRKLYLCSVIFDFSDAKADPDKDEKKNQNQKNDKKEKEGKDDGESTVHLAREMKRTLLLELVEHISQNPKSCFTDLTVPAIVDMLSANLFRSLPPAIYDDFDPDEDDPNFDPQWPHLQFVYEFFHRFAMSGEVKIIRKHIDRKFLVRMIDLFDSEDPRERDYLKMILHRIYGRCMPFRAFIRKTVNNVLYNVIYNHKERHHGISELFEILGSIINGFALPLKEEHVRFLKNVLIPMHKVTTLQQFHAQLAYCVTQFIQKDPTLATPIIGGMLKYWPQTSCQKELLFLNELEEVLELTGGQQLKTLIDPLFTQISSSIGSRHFQVAERALFLWNNDIIATFTSDNRQKILPIIYPALSKNYNRHWNSTVSSLTLNIIRIFKEMDKKLYEQVANKYKEATIKSESEKKIQIRKSKWETIKKRGMINQQNNKSNNKIRTNYNRNY